MKRGANSALHVTLITVTTFLNLPPTPNKMLKQTFDFEHADGSFEVQISVSVKTEPQYLQCRFDLPLSRSQQMLVEDLSVSIRTGVQRRCGKDPLSPVHGSFYSS